MSKLIDGMNEVALDADDLDAIFGALEDYNDTYFKAEGKPDCSTLDKLRKVYHMPAAKATGKGGTNETL